MNSPAILYPMFGLALWTALVLLLIPWVRIAAARRKEVTAKDFLYGESARVPPAVSIPNRNYMNLLEIPMLFYVVCLLIYVAGLTTTTALYLAWAYVALRVVHSAIHLTYNNVMHRLGAFTLSNLVLVALWLTAAAKLSALHT
jgi:hypothetical protein